MQKSALLATLPMILGGCAAYVPSLEAESTFSYAEVAAQIECETYLAVSKIEMERHFHNRHGVHKDPSDHKEDHLDYVFKHWFMSIQLKPNLIYDGSLGIGFTTKSSSTAKTYFQWMLGGGISPGGAAYESYGSTFADNTYIFPVMKLFDKDSKGTTFRNARHEYTMDDINPQIKNTCSPSPNRPISAVVKAMVDSEDLSLPNTVDKRFSIADDDNLRQDAVPNILDYHGLFGIYDFLDRSLAANGTLDVLPYSIGFSKEYRVKVNVGVTPGWYVPTGNTSPTIGAARTVDNIVSVVFTPPDDAKLKKVVIQPLTKGPGLIPALGPALDQSSLSNGVGTGAAERLRDTNNNLQLQNIQNQINQLIR